MGGTIGVLYGYEYESFLQKQKIKQNLIEISHHMVHPTITEKELVVDKNTTQTGKKKKRKKRRDTPYFFSQSPTRRTQERFKLYMKAKYNHNYVNNFE